MAAMELGLAHSLSRYKLKFSPDKIDTMIVQVSALLTRSMQFKSFMSKFQALLDDFDKESCVAENGEMVNNRNHDESALTDIH